MNLFPVIGILFLVIGSMGFLGTENKKDQWHKAFNEFAAKHRPDMDTDFRDQVADALYDGTKGSLYKAATLAGMSVKEAGLKVRKFNPEVKQNMDLLGTHNWVLFYELKMEGLIDDSDKWFKSQQWKAYRKFFQHRPDMGTMKAAQYFCRLARTRATDDVVMIWKTGKVGTVPGLCYLMGEETEHGHVQGVKELRSEILQALHRR